MSDIEIKNVIARNIVKFRKHANLTQIELAEKLNYSDKAVSKWERAESMPDIVVLKRIADIFEVSVDSLLSEVPVTKIHIGITVEKQIILPIICCFAVFFVAAIGFGFFTMLMGEIAKSWLFFVYAFPVSSAILVFFGLRWKKLLYTAITASIFVWSFAVALFFSFVLPYKFIFFIISAPLQAIIVLWYIMARLSRKRKRHIEAISEE